MDKIKQIKLIEQPREDIKLSAQDESSLFGGYYCSGTYIDNPWWVGDDCVGTYHANGSCRSYCAGVFKEA